MREREGRKRCLVDVQKLHTHRTQCPVSTEVRAPAFDTNTSVYSPHFSVNLTCIRSSSRPTRRSNIISSNFSSCFKMSPRLHGTLEALCAYFFGPGGHLMTALLGVGREQTHRVWLQLSSHTTLVKKIVFKVLFFVLKCGCDSKALKGWWLHCTNG